MEGNAIGGTDARGAEGNAIGGELASGLGNGNMQNGEESTLHKGGREHTSISSASVEVSALLPNRYMILYWV
jgi:hypothetical protein